MAFDASRYHRRSIRLRGYDYAQAGAYFVTICVQDRAALCGDVVAAEIRLNPAGAMVVRWWDERPRAFPNVATDAFVVMPNHVHGIVVLGTRPEVRPADVSLPRVVQWFKTMTTNEYIRGAKELGWPPFRGRLWQRNYYEHIIRNDVALTRLRSYVADNPARRDADQLHPNNPSRW